MYVPMVTFRLLFLRSRIGINYLLNADQVQFRSWKAVNCVILLFHPLSCNALPSMPINIVAYSRTIVIFLLPRSIFLIVILRRKKNNLNK